jgi:aspartate/methionine/tyrosine aminotransferase
MPTGVSKRLAAIEESATLAITARAKELRAAGEPVIGFGAGEPDFPTPDHIVAAAIEACRDPVNHKYSPPAGLPDLRQAVADITKRTAGIDVSPSQVVITNGGKGAIFAGLAALLDPGDEVLMPAPYWVTYPEAIALAGGVMRVIPTDVEAGFRATVDQLEAARTPKTKVLIFVSPSNPSGAVYTPEEVSAIGKWAVDNDVWVLTDDIYDHLVYGEARFSSIAAVSGAAERTVIANGVSKTFAMTGWRVGWLIAPDPVAKAVTRFQSHASSNVANVAQRAALAALTGPTEPIEEMRKAFDRRRGTMTEMLQATPGVDAIEPEGAFYAFPSVEGLLGRPLGGAVAATSMELAALLLDQIKIAVVPGDAFGAPGYLRFSFALSDEHLKDGMERFQELVGS